MKIHRILRCALVLALFAACAGCNPNFFPGGGDGPLDAQSSAAAEMAGAALRASAAR